MAGEAYCWGYGSRGALGNGGEADTAIPVPVEGGLVFSFIASGSYHSCALTAVGQTFCWGWNLTGQLGNGVEGSNSYLPIPTVWH
jgi:alpha-tubulin suppressor-like RCC1 family protein